MKILITIIIICSSLIIYSSDLFTTAVVIGNNEAPEYFVQNGVRYRVLLSDGNKTFPKKSPCYSTAFFIKTKNNIYLVTSKEVSLRMNDSSFIKFKSNQNNFAEETSIKQLTGKVFWLNHKKADVAIMPLSVNEIYLNKQYSVTLVDYTKLINISSNMKLRVVYVGFENGLKNDIIYQPQINGGIIKNKDQTLLIDGSQHKGLIGSPVFDKNNMLVGIVSKLTESNDFVITPSKDISSLIYKLEKFMNNMEYIKNKNIKRRD